MMNLSRLWVISIILYLGLNAVALFLPISQSQIPGMTTFVGWGLVLPVLMILLSWGLAFNRRDELSRFWLWGLVSTIVYAAAGLVTLKIVSEIWATI